MCNKLIKIIAILKDIREFLLYCKISHIKYIISCYDMLASLRKYIKKDF